MPKFGISLFFTEYSMTPADLAREPEQRGFMMDPFVTLTAADVVLPALDDIGALMAAVNQ